MDIRHLTDDFAVSPQIRPEDMAALIAAGFRSVVCNRPDSEIDATISAQVIREAVEAAGMSWAENIIDAKAMTLENVNSQGALADTLPGPVFAYCRSGTRSATAWALSRAGKMPIDDIFAAAARGGYALEGLRPQIEALAAQNS